VVPAGGEREVLEPRDRAERVERPAMRTDDEWTRVTAGLRTQEPSVDIGQ